MNIIEEYQKIQKDLDEEIERLYSKTAVKLLLLLLNKKVNPYVYYFHLKNLKINHNLAESLLIILYLIIILVKNQYSNKPINNSKKTICKNFKIIL